MRFWARGIAILILLAALPGCEIVPKPLSDGPAPGAAPAAPTPAPTPADQAAPSPTTAPEPAAGPLPMPALPPAPAAGQATGPAIAAVTEPPALPALAAGQRRAQIAGRLTALRVWLANTGRRAVLLSLPENFAWATFGGENQPVADAPPVSLAVLPDRALLVGPSDVLDLVREPLSGLGLRGLSYRWDLGRDPAAAVQALRGVAGPGVIAADTHRPGAEYVADAIAERRLPLTLIERQRLAWLAATTGETVAQVLAEARADTTQAALAAELRSKLTTAGVAVADLRMAALDRLTAHGLGAPGAGAVGAGVAVHVTATRWGLKAVVGRSVAPGADPAAVEAMTTARRVYAGVLGALAPGKVLRDVYRAASTVASAAGAGEPFAVQPPGGVGAYQPFTRLFGPTAVEQLAPQQAAQITVLLPGAYLADTVLLGPDGLRVATLTPGWPAPQELVNGRPAPLPTLRGGELAVVAAEAERRAAEDRAAALSFVLELVGGAARQALEATPRATAEKPETKPAEAAAEPAEADDEDDERPRPAAGATAP